MAYRLIAPFLGQREMGASRTLKKVEFDKNFADKIAPKVNQFHLERFKAFVDSAEHYSSDNVNDLTADDLIRFSYDGEYHVDSNGLSFHDDVMQLHGLTGSDVTRYDTLTNTDTLDSEGVPANFFIQDLRGLLTSSGGASLFFIPSVNMLDSLHRVLGGRALTQAVFNYLGKGKGQTSNEVKHLLDGTYLASSGERRKFASIDTAFNGEFFQSWYAMTGHPNPTWEAAAVAADTGLNRNNANQRIKAFLQAANTALAVASVANPYRRVKLTELGLAAFVAANDYIDDDGDEELPDYEGDRDDLMSGWTMDDSNEAATGEVEFNKTTGWDDGVERRFRADITAADPRVDPTVADALFTFEEEDDDEEEDDSVDVGDGSIPLGLLKSFYGVFIILALWADIRSQADKKLDFERFGKGQTLTRYTHTKSGLPGNENDYKSKKKQKKKPHPDTLVEYLAEIRTDFFVKWVGVLHAIEKRQWEEFFKDNMIDREIQWYNSSISSRFTVAQYEPPPEDVTAPVVERGIERIIPRTAGTGARRDTAVMEPLSFERMTLNKRLDSPTLRIIAREYNTDYYRYIMANVERLTQVQIRKETTGKKSKKAAAFKSPIDLYDKIWDYLEGVIISVVGNPDVRTHVLWGELFGISRGLDVQGFMPADWYGSVTELDLIRDPSTIGQLSNTDRNSALMKDLIQHLKNTQFRNRELLSQILAAVENSKLDSITELSELSDYMQSRLKNDQKRYYRKDGDARVDYYPAYSRYIAICRMLLTLPSPVLVETLADERQRVMEMAATSTSTDTTEERMEEAIDVGTPSPEPSAEDTVRVNPLRPTW